jgi:acetolactate decarboxylase
MDARPILILALAAACRTAPAAPEVAASEWGGELRSWGTLREALREGQVEGRVALADVARKGVYAVGALEDLEGEVTIADGELWITEGDTDAPVTSRPSETDARATLLFAAEVAEWHRVELTEAVEPDDLDAFLAAQARALGLDTARPFPFVVEGGLRDLRLHVIAGECPMRARMTGEELTSPPFELETASAQGRLVGIYAEDAAGVVSHGGSSHHAHVLLEEEGPLTGHVESVALAAGSVLALPRR